MKKSVLITILGVAVVATACVSYASRSEKPEYLQAAESRVSSYLTSDYGRVTCESKPLTPQRWQLACLNAEKGLAFQYIVQPAEKAPYNVSRPFYLEATNGDAIKSAEQGLMRYLQINTKTS
ncbi:hypothetical protein O7047_09190 [Pseudenterobacter timonensis]|uniref:Uncharacterized protein n=1 Tax=Pseudenterobacter timonensis TaxID=1755099 RepID=A0AAE4DMU3_9ENTR|nr:hypothetical protein [Pseudenterobacter timonensis]MDR9890404.1 hypothetical protein [Pseudenterobacter timonensis]